MEWVDTLGDARWSRVDLENRARNELARDFPDAEELRQQVSQFAAGGGLLAAGQRDRLEALAAARARLAAQVEAEVERDWLTGQRIAVEMAQYELAGLPEEDDTGRRAELQAIVNGASPEVLSLVVQRNRFPAEMEAA
jgi:hypothetical protein